MITPSTSPTYDDPIAVSRGIMPMGFNSMAGGHHHDCYEIFYVVNGWINAFVDNKTYHVDEGCMILVDANVPHAHIYPQDVQVERIYMGFNKEFLRIVAGITADMDILEAFSSDINVIRCSAGLRKLFEDSVDKMIAEAKGKKRGSGILGVSLLLQLLVTVNRKFKELGLREQVLDTPAYYRATGIIEYIRSNYARAISLDDISMEFNISRYYLIKVFKRYTGFTPMEYVNNVRILKAMEMLAERDRQTITDIAEATGFGNTGNFYRTFKKITGVAPQKYRNLNSNG